jgi:hypothetical protein
MLSQRRSMAQVDPASVVRWPRPRRRPVRAVAPSRVGNHCSAPGLMIVVVWRPVSRVAGAPRRIGRGANGLNAGSSADRHPGKLLSAGGQLHDPTWQDLTANGISPQRSTRCPVRNVQPAVSDADPRTTMRYDRARTPRQQGHRPGVHLHRRRALWPRQDHGRWSKQHDTARVRPNYGVRGPGVYTASRFRGSNRGPPVGGLRKMQ